MGLIGLVNKARSGVNKVRKKVGAKSLPMAKNPIRKTGKKKTGRKKKSGKRKGIRRYI